MLTFLPLAVQGISQALIDGMDFRGRDVEYKFSRAQQEFIRDFKYVYPAPNFTLIHLPEVPVQYSQKCRIIRRCASEPNHSSYIASEMIPAYREAASQSGELPQQLPHS
jgi:hypothetical protein